MRSHAAGSIEGLAQRVSIIEDAGSCEEEDDVTFSQVTGEFARFGDKNGIVSKSYTLSLFHGYTVVLKGWTHTRNYHQGFLRNIKGNAYATVSNLKPGRKYKFSIWQLALTLTQSTLTKS